MSRTISLQFASSLHSSREAVWEWITSVEGIRAEMRPVLRMTVPKSLRGLADVQITPGRRLFRSLVLLFGIVPIDYSDLTLIEMRMGEGFIEQSPMGSMLLWRHERRIVADHADPAGVILVDRLTFQPRGAATLVGWFVKRFFEHRHAVLRAHFGSVAV